MHLFNPDNDLALAHFGPFYTPPAPARKLAEDLALLPVWYGEDDTVVAEGAANHRHLDWAKTILPVSASLISFAEIKNFPQQTLKPWGWNPALRRRLADAGAGEDKMPSAADLQRLRQYSSRENAVKMLGEIKSRHASFCGESHFFTTFGELAHYLSSSAGDQFLKMPLSGSGKGLVRVIGAITGKQEDWCRRVIRSQGGVVAEPVFDKVRDLAMEFRLSEANIRFVAHSLFATTSSGAYAGNELLPAGEMTAQLSRYTGMEAMEELKSTLETKLSAYFPLFTGFAGVDMMICRNPGGTLSLHPCVEINMRMTMGIAAHKFYERFVQGDRKGIFRIAHFKSDNDALAFAGNMQKEHPLKTGNGKMVAGFLPLTAVGEGTRYVAFVVAGE